MPRTLSTDEAGNITITTTTETVVATLSSVSTPRRVSIPLEGWAQITTGVGATALTARIRRGTDITGVLLGEANAEQLEAAAGSTEEIYVSVSDPSVDLAGATYVLTVQQTAATGDGTKVQSSLRATIPD